MSARILFSRNAYGPITNYDKAKQNASLNLTPKWLSSWKLLGFKIISDNEHSERIHFFITRRPELEWLDYTLYFRFDFVIPHNVSVKSKLQHPPPGHLTPFPAREGRNLIARLDSR